MAKQANIYIVANIGTVIWCNVTKSPATHCPIDGRFQYNTNVIFDHDGLLVALYHKYNLFGERFFDQPPLKIVTFPTPYGLMGTGTCFDLLFKEPLITMIDSSSDYPSIVVLPSFWLNKIPFLAMYEYAEGWAIRMNTVLLVANVHSPETAYVGSGVFGPTGVINYTYVTDKNSPGQLLVARIPSNVFRDPSEPRSQGPHFLSNNGGAPRSFRAKTNGDIFTYVRLGPFLNHTASCCQESLCCYLRYSLRNFLENTSFFALGAFSGIHNENYTLYNQVCAVVLCTDYTSCGDLSAGEDGISDMFLQGNFSTETFVFPTVLMDGAKLANPDEWHFHARVRALESKFTKKRVLAFSMYGRCFSKDPALSRSGK